MSDQYLTGNLDGLRLEPLTVNSDEPSRFICFEFDDYNIDQWTLISFVPFQNTQAALAFAFTLRRINFFEMAKLASSDNKKYCNQHCNAQKPSQILWRQYGVLEYEHT